MVSGLLVLACLLAAYEAAQRNRLIDAAEIREALRLADISIEKACQYMVGPPSRDYPNGKPKDRALLERQLNGDGHLRHTELCQLPISFWREYLILMLVRVGFSRRAKREVAVFLAVTARKRMARVSFLTSRQLQQRKGRAS